MMRIFPAFSLVLSLSAFLAAPTQGAPSSRSASSVELGIAAVVNDHIITEADVKNRINLIQLLTSRQMSQNLQEIVTRTLVEEVLKMDLAARARIEISEEEVNQGIDHFIKMSQLPMDRLGLFKLLQDNNIDVDTLKHQIRSQIGWQKGIQAYYHTQAMPSDPEIEQELKSIETERQGTQYDLWEIFLPTGRQDEQTVLKQAHTLLKHLQKGERFEILAQQFSQSATASKGGHKGWVSESHLDPQLAKTLKSMTPGAYSDPVRVKGGFCIVLLKNRKEKGRIEKISFRQGLLRIEPQSETEMLSAQLQLQETLSDVHSCPAFEKVFKSLPAGLVEGMENVNTGALLPQLQKLLSQTPPQQVTDPMWIPEGLTCFMVCRRSMEQEPLPTREEVMQSLYSEKINRFALKTLRDLRQRAWIHMPK